MDDMDKLAIVLKFLIFGVPGLIWIITAIRRRKARKDGEKELEQ